MTDVYKPKYLKLDPTTNQEMEDAEVFTMVNSNPSRKVDAKKLPPIVMDVDGKMFFTDPTPSAEEIWNTLWGCAMLGMAVLIGVFAVVCLIVTRTVNATFISWLIVGTMAVLAILKLKGEKKNVQQ